MVDIAVCGDCQPPLASTPRLTRGPTASRTARTRATSASGSIPTFTFIFAKPWAMAHRAISAALAGSTPETDHFVDTERGAGSGKPEFLLAAPCSVLPAI